MLSRRNVLLAAGAGLTVGPMVARTTRADGLIPALQLVEPLGTPSVVWTAFNLLQPALQTILQCPVEVKTVTGNDGLKALQTVLEPSPGAVRLYGGPVMSVQYLEKTSGYGAVKLEDMVPIAKLSNGFSVALFTTQKSPLTSWSDAVEAANSAPLAVSCLERATAAYLAKLILERKAGLAMDVTLRDTLGEVFDDVQSGRAAAGILPTAFIARDRDGLRGLLTFGAQRNAILTDTPTYAEVSGQRKLAFTESIAALGAPGLDTPVATRLTDAFMTAGQDPTILQSQESALFPVVVNGPEILRGTLARDERVLDRVLG